MEFNNLMNRYLRQDAEGRRRRLHIRTYVSSPLISCHHSTVKCRRKKGPLDMQCRLFIVDSGIVGA